MDDLLAQLNPEQRAAVEHGEGPLLILAGAGSGKTRVLTHRFAHLIRERDVSPRRIMAVTFTNKAANEMKERVGRIVERIPWEAWIGTFHALSARMLRRHGASIGVDPNFTIFDDADQLSLIRQCVKHLDLDEKQYPPRALLSAVSRAKERLWTPQEFSRHADGAFQETAAAIYRHYQDRLALNNALDFDDILFNAVEMFRHDAKALEEYQETFEHVLIDEYQDINTAQFELVRRLAARRRNICAVGDDDQSIYRFRGADVRNILDFELTYPDAKIVKLEQNYRSTSTILDAAWHVVSQNRSRKEKRLWTAREGGEPLRLYIAEDDYDEAEFIANQIEEGIHRSARYGDCAVLYRINAQSRVLEEVMVRRQIPYRIVGGLRFYDRKEIKDVLAYLRVLHNPSDSVSLTRILNVPPRGIGEKTVEKLTDLAERERCSLYEAVGRSAEAAIGGKIGSALRSLHGTLESVRVKARGAKISELLPMVLERSGYRAMLDQEGSDESRERAANLEELVNVSVQFENRSPDPSLGAFLEQASLLSGADSYEEGANAVTLMTLHAAKGLEFPRIFLAGLDEGLFPLSRSMENDDDLEEERRLCYVGMTRARDELYLTRAYARMRYGREEPCMASRFLTEIPPGLFKGVALKSARLADRSGRPKAPADLWSRYQAPGARAASAPAAPSGRRTSAPAVDSPFKSGAKVRHEKFGDGIVVSVESAGMIAVVFEGIGLKKLSLEYAKLERIG